MTSLSVFQSTPPAEETGPPGSQGPPGTEQQPAGSLWCPWAPLSTLGADLSARLTGGLAKFDWTALGRPKMPLKGVRAQLGWCRCLKVSSTRSSGLSGGRDGKDWMRDWGVSATAVPQTMRPCRFHWWMDAGDSAVILAPAPARSSDP